MNETVQNPANEEPITLTKEEQAELVKQIVDAKRRVLEIQNLPILNKSDSEMTSAEHKWFNAQDKDTMLHLYELRELSDSELKNLKYQAEYTRDTCFNKLWASVMKLARTELGKKYKTFTMTPEKRDALYSATAFEIFKSLDNFDPSKGAFSTYIIRYIWQGGNQTAAESNNSTVRNNWLRKKILDAQEEIIRDGGTPTPLLIAEKTELTLKTVKMILNDSEAKENTLSIEAMEKGSETFSDDNREDTSLKSYNTPEEEYEDNEYREAVSRTMNLLDPITKKIIEIRCGFNDSRDITLTDGEIAKRLNITIPEVISRYNTGIRSLKSYIEDKEPILNNTSVKEKKDEYDRLIRFQADKATKEDLEDARSIMDSISLDDLDTRRVI